MPSGYTVKKWLPWPNRFLSGTTNLRAQRYKGEGRVEYDAVAAAISETSLGTGRIGYSLPVPTSIEVVPDIAGYSYRATGANTKVMLSSLAQTVASASGASPNLSLNAQSATIPPYLTLTTNSSGQIGAIASNTVTELYVDVRGFVVPKWMDY